MRDTAFLKNGAAGPPRHPFSAGRMGGRLGGIHDQASQISTRLFLANGIRPFPTLYHWDLPQALQDEGGWANRDIIGHFTNFADTCIKALGDRVKRWMVFNEPWVFTFLGYIAGIHAPGLRDRQAGMRAMHIANLAQASATRAMRAAGTAEAIGTAFSMTAAYPYTESEEDRAAAERQHAFSNDWFL